MKIYHEEIKLNEVEEKIPEQPVVVEEPKKEGGFKNFLRKNAGTIVGVAFYGGMAALAIGGIVKGYRNQNTFEKLIQQKYNDPSITEGIFAEGNMKKLWDGNRAFEESYKGNFDKVADFVKGLNMRADENYSISRVVDKSGKIATELVMTRDGGFYHGIQL